MADLGFLLSGCLPAEQAARLRELRALALVYLGLRHPVTAALGEAIGDPSMVDRALAELGAVPALRRRRLLCAYAALIVKQDWLGDHKAFPPVRARESSRLSGE
ncbi:MAG TPA: hypothetical protein VHT00_02885 [Stellaceae bacterium]|jgi:hypothetical protein|nr:hypothetical protein [Stellaceae bacterium]HEX3416950.1 hypothetical protein [Stellaceae bacterium]